ncbi:hypothetical protein C3L21_35585 (plasmid) [Sinorhizobium meliloti]|nr:hypothetical protein C3L21_35585 [Sinorhizobium meliloti]
MGEHVRTFRGLIHFETHASETHGTVDWKLTFPDGNSGWAYSRLTRNIEGVIFAFNFVLPPMPEDELEKARLAQKANIENELANAKAALEARHE